MVGFLLLTVIMIAVVAVLWTVWVARERAQQRARDAEAAAERLGTLAEGADGLAHDVAGLLSVVSLNLRGIDQLVLRDPEEAERVLGDASDAIGAATQLLRALRAEMQGDELDASTADLVRLQASLYRGRVPVALTIEDDLPHGGDWEGAARVIHNLFDNAVREAEEAGGGVEAELSAGRFRIRNPTRRPEDVSERMFERGTSGWSSSGTGLAVSREIGRQLGWKLTYERDGEHVVFIAEPTRPSSDPAPTPSPEEAA